MNCKDSREMIEAYIDNGIDPLEDKVLAEHISSCEECRGELEIFLKYSDSIKSLKPVKAPDNFILNLNRRIESETGGLSIVERGIDFILMIPRMRFSMEAAGMAALVLILLIVYKPFTVVEKKYSELEVSVSTSEAQKEGMKQDQPAQFKPDERGPGVSAKKSEKYILSSSDQEKDTGGPAGAAKVEEQIDEQRSEADTLQQRGEERLSISGASDTAKMERSESAVNRSKSVYADIRQDSPEDLFAKHKAAVIKKERLEDDKTGYILRISSDRYPLLLKELEVNYDVEEISISRENGVTTAELLIGKK